MLFHLTNLEFTHANISKLSTKICARILNVRPFCVSRMINLGCSVRRRVVAAEVEFIGLRANVMSQIVTV